MLSIRALISYGVVASSGTLIGYDSGYLNGVLASTDFNRRFGESLDGGTYKLTSTTRALFTSMLAAGTLLGCVSAAFIPTRFSRRHALITASLIYSIGVALQVAAPTGAAFIIGRVLLGLALGVISIVSPAYLIEASTPSNRGLLICLFQQVLTAGNVLACGISMGTEKLKDDATWRITIAFQLVLALAIAVGGFLAVESPMVSLKLRRLDQARSALATLHSLEPTSPVIDESIEILRSTLESDGRDNATMLECFRGTERRRTLLGVAMGWFTIGTGITFWFGYGTSFFQAAGVQNAYLVSLGLALVNAALTTVSFFLVERVGRRCTLFCGSFIMGTTQLVAGIVHTTMPGSPADRNCLIVCAVLFIAGYASTWGPVGWITMSEPFSARGRQNQQAVTMFAYWTATWAVGFCTPYLVDNSSLGGAGLGINITYLWCGIVLVTTLWAYFCLPELRGLSFSQTDRLFLERVPAWRSIAWQRSISPALNHGYQVEEVIVGEEKHTGARPCSLEKM
ncbi:monosaccharide transporter [Phlyctema vagabunda]|uniref:Monosaccharide transporter n=1 Tax=Phlyctema vagabunda TaxID=108571 RepID=A0ABR4PSU1_9HELO